ncbi:MAG: hypothetical protein RJA34_3075 [Pseudomonadota bacterium]
MRGGTLLAALEAEAVAGLSPHARGNPTAKKPGLGSPGPIPTCAGEPSALASSRVGCRAYPRMRGGTQRINAQLRGIQGLSPHARGNLPGGLDKIGQIGPIPACAGEPGADLQGACASWAYPRMRGGTADFHHRQDADEGLSPHARGNRFGGQGGAVGCGPIPACAGEPVSDAITTHYLRAYPRMRGGTNVSDAESRFEKGLSPHARGNRTCVDDETGFCGPIPACAGEPSGPLPVGVYPRAYPRMRGGTPGLQNSRLAVPGLSPHARGNRKHHLRINRLRGPIPACAGEPGNLWLCFCDYGAYPRMRGGTSRPTPSNTNLRGLSPHARGNRTRSYKDRL